MRASFSGLLLVAVLLHLFARGEAERCHCSNKIVMLFDEGDYRVINTPDYPRYYCPKLDCLWRIVAPTNESRIYFYADNLDLREEQDFIEFYDEKFVTDPGNETATHSCTGEGACRFESAGQYLSIRFTSGIGESDSFGFQGTVSAYDRERSALLALGLRYGLCGLGGLALLVAVVAVCCCIRERKRRSGDARLILAPGVTETDGKQLL